MFNFVSGYPSWGEYLQSMAKDGTWSDHVVLFAAANRFQTSIRIISSLDREIVVHPEHAVADPNPLVLGHIHELHYVSLQSRKLKGTILATYTSLFLVAIGQVCLTGGKCVASHADVLRGSSRVLAPQLVGQERVTNP